jgi:hypothetical protein
MSPTAHKITTLVALHGQGRSPQYATYHEMRPLLRRVTRARHGTRHSEHGRAPDIKWLTDTHHRELPYKLIGPQRISRLLA